LFAENKDHWLFPES